MSIWIFKIKAGVLIFNFRKEPFVSGHDLKAFMFVFPTLVNDLSRDIPQIPQFKDNFEKIFYCNVSNRKQKSLMLLTAYKELKKPKNITNEDIKLANILAWCMEMVSWKYQYQYYFL